MCAADRQRVAGPLLVAAGDAVIIAIIIITATATFYGAQNPPERNSEVG